VARVVKDFNKKKVEQKKAAGKTAAGKTASGKVPGSTANHNSSSPGDSQR